MIYYKFLVYPGHQQCMIMEHCAVIVDVQCSVVAAPAPIRRATSLYVKSYRYIACFRARSAEECRKSYKVEYHRKINTYSKEDQKAKQITHQHGWF